MSGAPAFSPSLRGRALRLLAAREHSRAELQRKLAPHETEPGSLARALDELAAKGFISEQRVAESVARRRGARLGAARVIQELRAKGVEAQVLAETAAQLKDTELARARDVWVRKFGEPAADPAARLRQMRFLAARGFAPEVIRRVVKGAEDDA
ncbi:MAG: recombination regulator RecX [Ramlibacter sp.]|jgi:regulatory protein|nr:recombination regulator RecX [Ramlibacter sp.]